MANEGIEVEVYRYSAPLVKVETLNGRVAPKFLAELTGVGGGSIQIAVDDPKLVADPTLIDQRNILKCRLNGIIVGAFIIGEVDSTFITDGEESKEVYNISGEGLKTLFNDAVVSSYNTLTAASLDTRTFNWASERGSWYVPSQWVTPWVYGQVFKTPVYGDGPDKWPPKDTAKWIWSQAYADSAPVGTSYFRYEINNTIEQDEYVLYVAADNTLTVYLDGEILATSGDKSAFSDATRIEITLTYGVHVLGLKVENFEGTGINPAAVILSMYKTNHLTNEVFYMGTGDPGWLALNYPPVVPGWSPGEILLKLMAEAKDRGVLFPNYVTPTFDAVTDSNGEPWDTTHEWTFKVGDSLSTVVAKLEALVCKLWINPESYYLYAVKERSTDRSVFVYDTDGITALSTPVIFEKGKNLRKATTKSIGNIVNTLSVRSGMGWHVQEDTDSVTKYGRVEGSLSTDAVGRTAVDLGTFVLSQRSTEEQGASYDVYPTTEQPFLDYEEGDWVLAPDRYGALQRRQIMSISVEESSSGVPLYTIEFDTVFQDNEARLNSAVANLGQGGAGGGVPGAGSDSGTGGPIIISPPTAPVFQQIPKAPANVVATSTGYWSPDGITAYSEVTLTWNPVIENTDGTTLIPSAYEVWAHLTSAGDGAYARYASVPSNTAIIRPFMAGSNWTFKVLAKGSARDSAFSDTITHTMVGPNVPLTAPSAPTLSSDKGVLIVNWNGLLAGSLTPPPQFRYVYARVATAAAGPYVQMGGALQRTGTAIYISGLTIGTQYWVQLFAVDGSGIGSAASSSSTITLTGIDLGDLDASIGNAIDAAHAAGLAARSMDNMLNGGGFEENDPTLWSLNTANVKNVTTTPYSGTRALEIDSTTADYTASNYGMVLQVVPGETYSFAGMIRALGSSATVENGIGLGVDYGVDSATLTSHFDIIGSPAGLGTTYLNIAGTWQVPAGIHYVRPTIDSRDHSGTNKYLLDELVFRMVIPGALIVNGAISADKIGAGAIIAGKIAAGAIAAENIQAGAVTAGKIQAGSITALELAAGSVTANSIAAGSITTLALAAEVGKNLDISSNNAVNIIVGQINDVTTDQNATADSLQTMQTYYSFGPTGAVISSPSSPYGVHIANDRIEMLQLGIPVSYWAAGQMFVNSLVGTEVVLGNHKLEKYTTGTVVRAL